MIRAQFLKCRLMLVSHLLNSFGTSGITCSSVHYSLFSAAASLGEALQRVGMMVVIHLDSLSSSHLQAKQVYIIHGRYRGINPT